MIQVEHNPEGSSRAHCCIWPDSLPKIDGVRPAAIGAFEASDPAAANTLLEKACARIRREGGRLAVGPINGTTWQSYRLVTERGDRPPFVMEPTHPDFYLAAWERAGFRPLAEFHSARMPPQTEGDPRIERVESRLGTLGVRIRNIDTDSFEEDLARIHEVSLVSFSGNFLYTPIPLEGFLDLYRPHRSKIRPEFIWIAEQAGRGVGFCFCLPDLNQAARGEPIDTLVVKTLATLPDRAYAGLGLLLTQSAHRAAAQEIGRAHV